MRLVFAGTPEVALPPLCALLDSDHEVVAVLTRPDARTGRGRRLRPSPVAELAAEHDIEVLKPERVGAPELTARLRELAPDCCPVVAYGAILGQDLLDIPRHGWVNLHFSVLPAWRGAAPVQRAIMAGDEVTGATTFQIVRALDAGPTYGVMTERISAEDTSGDLLDRLSRFGAGLLRDTIDGIASGEVEAREQPDDGVSYAPKIDVAECEIDWTLPGYAVDRHVRAVTPAPGAWTTVDGQRLKVGRVKRLPDADALPPGAVSVTKRNVIVGTADTPVELLEVQAQGKPRMAAADWARGLCEAPTVLGR